MSSLVHARYAPGEVLGRGAQGLVLRVTDREAPERALVAKVFRAGAFSAELLEGEFALLARIRIPGLVRAHDLSRDERTRAPFLVEDHVEGPDARRWVREGDGDGQAPLARLRRLAIDLTTTLAGLHDAGFVHGDLKPSNVRVARGRPVLLDLGAAVEHAARRAAVAMTRGYAAPEVLAGAPPGPASDLYGLGALLYASATGDPPAAAPGAEPLPDWVGPALNDLILALLAEHPRDRPANARDVLSRLAPSGPRHGAAGTEALVPSVASVGRDTDVDSLLATRERVTYVTGEAGIGKTHLVRDVVLRALLSGRKARFVTFPVAESLESALVDFLAGTSRAAPFRIEEGTPWLLVLDALERSAPELRAALESFRCRADAEPGPVVIAAAPSCPDAAPALRLSGLSEPDLARLVNAHGAAEAASVELIRQSGGNPGWLFSALGRVPLAPDAARARTKTLSLHGRELLALVALLGGEAPLPLVARFAEGASEVALAELSKHALVNRRGVLDDASVVLTAPALADDLSRALSTFEVVDRAADVLLEVADLPARLLLALSRAPTPPARRAELLREAARRAHDGKLRSVETDALLSLAADPHERTPAVLRDLERLTRGAGSSGLYPEVLSWIEETAQRVPSLGTLALRRRADLSARGGDHDAAERLLDDAAAQARSRGDRTEEALAFAGRGAVALYRGDHRRASIALGRAVALLEGNQTDDVEELARLEHNLGVVALYDERDGEALSAFERSLEKKRILGDRGGVWSCLLNIGLALSRLSRFAEADRALVEATALTESLGQTAGTGWCYAARAELQILRGDPRAARRCLAEAAALGVALPESVEADLTLARAEAALLDGNGRAAAEALAAIPTTTMDGDPLTRARALLIGARAELFTLPVCHRKAARGAIAALRAARLGGFRDVERKARATLAEALRNRLARSAAPFFAAPGPLQGNHPMTTHDPDDELWTFIDRAARGATPPELATGLALALVRTFGAERAFVVLADAAGGSVVHGVDVDGLPLSRSEDRVDPRCIEAARGASGPVYEPELPSAAGRGARLALASPAKEGARAGAVLVLEHRFAPRRFDTVDAKRLGRWASLAAFVARLDAPRSDPGEASEESTAPPELRGAAEYEVTTSVPVRRARRHFPALVGSSPAFEAALARLDAAVGSDLPVLILGETGVGKELFARALHDHGPRKERPLVALNCAAVPETLFEAELFGYEKGSFTGADRTRPGLLSKAEGGTLFLDEIGELALSRQAALLRVLETRTYRPVGGDVERPFDVRIVAATNRDLDRAATDGAFRRDLLYRLNVIELTVPPLRKRREDIGPLARHFILREGARAELTVDALTALEAYDWPGNVRELSHQIQRLLAASVDRIQSKHLPREIRGALARAKVTRVRPASEREAVERALSTTNGNITRAAAVLGLTRHGLKKRMVRLGMRAAAAQGGRGES